MKHFWQKTTAVLLSVSLLCTMTACTNKKSDSQQEDEATPAVSATDSEDVSSAVEPQGGVQASGKGNKKSDVPLVVGTGIFDKNFNPFSAQSEEDEKAVKLTQLHLVTVDREGALVNNAIAGVERRYNGEDYTYEGPANLKVSYSEQEGETEYTIRLRDDLVFSDGEPVTIDDVIFSMYVFADSSYDGCEDFGQLDIRGLDAYRAGKGKSAESIGGIERVNDYKVKVIVEGYDRDDIDALDIPICPLHFYGDVEQYNYEKNQFGFQKGDISSLIKKKNAPMGAGAYNFIKYESGIIYYEANEKYYKGCPLTAFIQLKEIGEETVEHKIEMLTEGDVDVLNLDGDSQTVSQILQTNSSGKLNGGTISTRLYDGGRYSYVGIYAEQVCVDEKPDSTRSKNLRSGLATLLGCNRSDVIATYVPGAKMINYPASDTSWSVPQSEDEEYTGAFTTDVDGQVIYNSHMSAEERGEAACKAALGYLKLAGYKVKQEKVVAAPKGASMTFQVLVPSDTDTDGGMRGLMAQAKELFEAIGLKLKIIDSMSEAQIEKKLKQGKQQIWCGFAATEANGNLYEMFHSKNKKHKEAGSENYFGISDSDLDEYIEDSRITTGLKKSISLYGLCYGKIMEWAVEVPVYQERVISIFRSSRVNMDTIVPDSTIYYGWTSELQSIEMK